MRVEDILRESAGELGVELGDTQIGQFLAYLELLKFWNKRINLTSIEDDIEIAVLHFIDSLTVIPFIGADSRLLDIGSGGGFPGLALKIALPRLRVTLIDSVEKKSFFLKEAIRKLGIEGAHALRCRAEDENNGLPRGNFNYVVSRAVGSVGELLDLSAPYLARGGRIILMRGARGREEWDEAAPQSDRYSLVGTTELHLPFGGQLRAIVVAKPI
ncbi:MAG: 16S rRNA (guanine(527)-N(7))-methyltransferase RsmG [Deltaproteobacteria bacterium]